MTKNIDKNFEKIKLKVDFYANGFRSGIIEIDKYFWEKRNIMEDRDKEKIICQELAKHLPYNNWKIWETYTVNNKYRVRGEVLEKNHIAIITAKIIR